MAFLSQHPVLAFVIGLLIAVITLVGALWKALNTLFVKPRDFEIESLKRRLEELTASIGELEQKESTNPTSSTQASRSPAGSTRTESAASSNSGRGRSKSNRGSNLASLDTLIESTTEFAGPELARSEYISQFFGATVIWTLNLYSFSDQSISGEIWLNGITEKNNIALCRFPADSKDSLVDLRKGDVVTVKGEIQNITSSVTLQNCTLIAP